MNDFKIYRSKTIIYARPYQKGEALDRELIVNDEDKALGHPKDGDMIMADAALPTTYFYLLTKEDFEKKYVPVDPPKQQFQLTTGETIYYLLRWIKSGRMEDITIAHDSYSQGSQYHWDKFLERVGLDSEVHAAADTILNMDGEALQLLADYITTIHQKEAKELRAYEEMTAEHERKIKNK